MRRTIHLSLLSGLSIVAAFVYQLVLLRLIGASRASDAFFASMALPQFVLAVATSSVSTVMLPMLAGESRDDAGRMAWTVAVAFSAILAAGSVVLALTTSQWTAYLFPGFRGDDAALLAVCCRIQLIALVANGFFGVSSALYYSRDRFYYVAITQLALAAAAIIVLIPVTRYYGVVGAAWLTSIRSIVQLVIHLPEFGALPRALHSETIRNLWHRLRPLLFGNAYYKTDALIDRHLSSLASAGELSLLYLAQQILGGAAQILNSAYVLPLIPLLTGRAKRSEWRDYHAAIRRGVFFLFGASLLGWIVASVAGPMLLAAVGRSVDLALLNRLFLALGGVLIAGSIGQLTSSAFYAAGDTRTPTIYGVITFTVYVPLKFLAFLHYGIVGLAWSTSIFTAVNMLAQWVTLQLRSHRDANG